MKLGGGGGKKRISSSYNGYPCFFSLHWWLAAKMAVSINLLIFLILFFILMLIQKLISIAILKENIILVR
jgi:hypothetical protein